MSEPLTQARRTIANSGRKRNVIVPTFTDANQPQYAPKLFEAQERRREVKKQYLEAMTRLQYVEEAESRAKVCVSATTRLRKAFDAKRKVEEEKTAEKEMKAKRDAMELEVRLKVREDERRRKEQTKKKMEELYMVKRQEVERMKADMQKLRNEHHQHTQSGVDQNREQCRQIKGESLMHRKQQQAGHAAAMSVVRETRRQEMTENRNAIRRQQEMDREVRQETALTIRTNRAKELSVSRKSAELKATVQKAIASRIDEEEAEILFYQQEMKAMHDRERVARKRFEDAKSKLKNLEIGTTYAALPLQPALREPPASAPT